MTPHSVLDNSNMQGQPSSANNRSAITGRHALSAYLQLLHQLPDHPQPEARYSLQAWYASVHLLQPHCQRPLPFSSSSLWSQQPQAAQFVLYPCKPQCVCQCEIACQCELLWLRHLLLHRCLTHPHHRWQAPVIVKTTRCHDAHNASCCSAMIICTFCRCYTTSRYAQ